MSIKICSIAPEEFKIKRSYNWNGIVLPACKKGESYSSVVIVDHTDMRVVAVDHWAEHSEKTPINIPADVIVRDFFATEGLRDRGAFIPASDTPTDAELATAYAARRAYLEKCVQDGDTEYSKSKRIDNIPGEWKRACVELNVIREWAFYAPPQPEVPEVIECEACGTEAKKLRSGKFPILCASCGYPFDKERAMKEGLWRPAQEETKKQKSLSK
jgi:hypothetical protein